MDILDIDISKRGVDAAFLLKDKARQAVFLSTETGVKDCWHG